MNEILEIPIVNVLPDHSDEGSPILVVMGDFFWKKGSDGYIKHAQYPKKEFEELKFVKIDLGKVAAEEEEMNRKFVYNPENNTLTLHIDCPYEIDLDRINTHQDLVGWLHHMSEKTWMHRRYLCLLIEHICQYKNWPIY